MPQSIRSVTSLIPQSDSKIDSFDGIKFLSLYPYVMDYQDDNGRECLVVSLETQER